MDAPLRARMLATAAAAAVVTLFVVVVVLPRWRKGAEKHAKAAALPAAEARALGEQLLRACVEERAGDALRLINEGADVNFRGEGGRMPLIVASANGLESITARLVEAGAELNLVDDEGYTALIMATRNGHAAIVLLLANKGAALDRQDPESRSALTWACDLGPAALAQMLAASIDAAALNVVDGLGKTALDYANQAIEAKITEFAPVAATIRARGGLTVAEQKAAARERWDIKYGKLAARK
jgi:hypothetical protein